jgi:cytochrome bd-type quinol oxidase subunit 2
MLGYLMIALLLIIIAYVFYRYGFLQKHTSHPKKPHFTLKIHHD